MDGEGPGSLALQLVGPLALRRGGVPQALPRSRKTRALLAYLAVSGKPERRDRLCELFWDGPDDPRGALRWSLSKLRALVDDPGQPRLHADREWVHLKLADEGVDYRRLQTLARHGLSEAPTAALEAALGAGDFLDGLELARCERFESWRIAHQVDVRRWRAAILAELTGRPLSTEAALAYARAWTEADADEAAPWLRLAELLEAVGRPREAEAQRALAARRLRGAGVAVPADLANRPPSRPTAVTPPSAEVRFCTAPDGVKIAYAQQGEGPPLVKTANWMTHLERDAEGPIWRHWIAEFTVGRSFVRYDQRGNGLSDWNAAFTQRAFVEDLEAVVDAAGLDRFDLLGLSQGASVALAYAVRHPHRVRRIVLLGAYARGWAMRSTPEQLARREAMLTLSRTGWDEDNPAFRQLFTSLFIPDADAETHHWFNTTQRMSTNGANAYALQRAGADLDIDGLLGRVKAPTLVAHRREDAVVPFETGRELAQKIAGARFLPLEGRNHFLLEDEPAWRRFADAARLFLEG